MQSIIKPSIPVATESQILDFFSSEYGTKPLRCYAYYSSDFDKIITDQKFMLIPLDERMASRAHAVFDTIYIKKMKLVNVRDCVRVAGETFGEVGGIC